MLKKDLISLSELSSAEVTPCKIIDRGANYIKFEVDEDLTPCQQHICDSSDDIIQFFLEDEQIDSSIANIIASSFANEPIAYLGLDVVYQCILKSFAEHRPLTLSPDIVWLIIAQTIAKYVNSNSEKLRDKFVSFAGQKELKVESPNDLFSEDIDWQYLLREFSKQVSRETKGNIADAMVCNFSTTQPADEIASIATLMGSVQSYFKYIVHHYICGIPSITIYGNAIDWKNLMRKASILNRIGLRYWYDWLKPILEEFVRAVNGTPNRDFWQSIVLQTRSKSYNERQSCTPNAQKVDGWFLALFPFRANKKLKLSSGMVYNVMDSEYQRVPFKYQRERSNGRIEEFSMELWAGFIGVDEDSDSYALTPKIGWFVRKSNEEDESFNRLKTQDLYNGIDITVSEVPILLKRFERIRALTITFTGPIEIPSWLDQIPIEKFEVHGKISRDERALLRSRFKQIRINPRTF